MTGSKVLLRNARRDEWDTVGALLVESYAQYAAVSDHPEYEQVWTEYRAGLADVASRHGEGVELIVAELAGAIVGTVTFYSAGSPPEGWPKDWAGIRLLGVVPDARGLGIGRMLTEECLRRARALGRKTVGLHTTVFMEIARDMYLRMGFVRDPDRDIDVGGGVTVLGYRLDL